MTTRKENYPPWKVAVKNNAMNVNIDSPLTGFGELSVADNVPYVQVLGSYDLLPDTLETFTNGAGAAYVEDQLFTVETGTSLGDYGAIQSSRGLSYKAGESGLARFTALFESHDVNSWQGAGILTISDELTFGFLDNNYGIWHRFRGKSENRVLTITTPSGGNETATVTLNGEDFTIDLISANANLTAGLIAKYFKQNVLTWNAEQLDNTVIFTAVSDGEKDGVYSLSSSTAAGSFARVQAGETKISHFYPRDEFVGNAGTVEIKETWNGSGLRIDPTKGNVHAIAYQYLGFGDILFYQENPNSGRFELVHTIKYANSHTLPSMSNPSVHIGLYATALGVTTPLKVRSASMAAFVQGQKAFTRNPRAVESFQSTNNSQWLNLGTIRNSYSYNGYINQVEMEPFIFNLASGSSNPILVQVRLNSNPVNAEECFNFSPVGVNDICHVSFDSIEVNSGTLIGAGAVFPNGGFNLSFRSDLPTRIPANNSITFAGIQAGGGPSIVAVAFSYIEDL